MDNDIINPEEMQYLNLVRRVMETGVDRQDRTNTGTRSIFGAQMRFSLRDHVIPLLTTKRVFWRGVVEELLWFISGSTDSKELAVKGVHIWDKNALGHDTTHGNVDDLGPIYGFQWRHFGAEYIDSKTNYDGQGIDQLRQCIDMIRENPTDRRIIMSAWNPLDISRMALPPCHCFCQFYVANGELSCQMYQRSADLGLGVPFNIASYSVLTRLVAYVCGLRAGEFIHTMGDCHIYLNHMDALKEQLMRSPRRFPRLYLRNHFTNPALIVPEDIDTFEFSDFDLEGYDPYPSIKMDMAV